MRKVILFFFILGCVGSQNKVSPSDTISLIVDGTFDDRGFNESSYKAIDQVKEEFEVKVIKKESRISDYLADMGGLEEAGSRLIWGISFKFTDMFLQKSIENSDINYAVIEGAYAKDVELPKNLVNVRFRSEEGAFLAGYLAAKISKTGKIGFVGGMDVAVVNALRYGYESGAKYANKNIELNSQYVGTFSDLSFGRSIASKMYASGVDIVFSAAGLSGLGAIEVAKELGDGHYIIGVDQDQSYLAPENIIISYVKRIDAVILDLTRAYLDFGKWNGGKELEFGLKDGVLDLIFNKLINVDLMSDYDGFSEVKNKIINNEIEVPRDKKSYDAFIVSLINKS